MWKWVDAVSLLLLTFLSFSFLVSFLLLVFFPNFSVCSSLAHCVWLSFSQHISLLIKKESKWVWQGCHVCSRKGQRGPVQRQEVSYPYISLCFCHQLDSPSLSFSVTLYLSPILFCPLCLSSLPVFPLSHFSALSLYRSQVILCLSLRLHPQSAKLKNPFTRVFRLFS